MRRWGGNDRLLALWRLIIVFAVFVFCLVFFHFDLLSLIWTLVLHGFLFTLIF